MSDEIHVGDVGTTFRATIKDSSTAVDLSSLTFTSILFFFQNPDGTVSTQTATSFSGSGTSGVVDFTVTTATIINTSGSWKLQAKVSTGSNIWYSDVYRFDVFSNLV